MIRQPIVSVLGHVDHGKTSLLDRIRGSAITAKEAGGITQSIGATEIPIGTLKEICGDLLAKIELTIPGLLFIDTPGHEAFSALRKRGGALADIAILVVDITEGLMPQTRESISILKYTKTPFVVAANKVDLIKGWMPTGERSMVASIQKQQDFVASELDDKVYSLVGAFASESLNSERYDRISDFTQQFPIVPVSAKTGEGVPDLLMVLVGIAQKFLTQNLKIQVHGRAKGSVLEVKKEKGMGTALDAIIYDGELKVGDEIVLYSSAGPLTTRVKSLLKPEPLMQMGSGRMFRQVDSVVPACGVRIIAPGVDSVLSGSPLRSAGAGEEEKAQEEILKEIASVKIETENIGVIVKADTLGALEAIIAVLTNAGIKIRRADVGQVSRKEVSEANIVRKQDMFAGVIFAFNVEILPDALSYAQDFGVKVLQENVIYRLVEDYTAWKKEETEKQRNSKVESLTKPGVFKILPGYVFRQSKPAVVGVEVVEGTITPKANLINARNERIGVVKEIQVENEPVSSVEKGKRAAVSITGAIVGKNIAEGDVLFVDIPFGEIEGLKNLESLLSESEKSALNILLKVKRIKL